jgi:tRNA(fMet)-specific endonuclease VapC
MLRLLDTNTCIYYLNRVSENLIARFRKYSPSGIKLSSITVAELFFGAEKSNAKKKNWTIVESFVSTFEIIPFNEASCRTYAKIRVSLEKKGSLIGPMDLLIASISLTNNFILVTNNTKEFSRISKLKLENWL